MSMTESEAIKVLEKPSKHIRMVHKTKNEMEFYTYSADLVEAFEKAISALEEVQQYRAIGTVKIFETVIKSQMEYCNRMREYEKIGTVSEFRELKEKTTAKKPIERTDDDGYVEFFCPNCEAHLFFDEEQKFCNECGQAIADKFD